MSAGIVLVGGRSSRMGTSKAALEWHGSTLLWRAAALLQRSLDGPVVVVRAPGQELPDLPDGVEVVADPVEGRGPLQGIATGLAAVAGRAEAAFVCPTDMPLLHPAFVRRVLGALGSDVDVVLPVALGFAQPLAAAYRTALAPRVAALVAAGRMRPAMLFAEVAVLRLDEAALLADPDLAAADPALDSLLNVNEPTEYRRARDRPAPEVTVVASGTSTTVRASTLGSVDIPATATVTLNGVPIRPAPGFPLVAGDNIALT
ncbi:molybdenum cofactor guanylyltransferase [Pseudonocardia sp. GCM10023141]|uniref:molybdenum cofactor guanylyltransferase n=1 Tax=Pseudonocardia sp. GCM10023141 TaxID=3252653 RepID=UPI00360D3C06